MSLHDGDEERGFVVLVRLVEESAGVGHLLQLLREGVDLAQIDVGDDDVQRTVAVLILQALRIRSAWVFQLKLSFSTSRSFFSSDLYLKFSLDIIVHYAISLRRIQ